MNKTEKILANIFFVSSVILIGIVVFASSYTKKKLKTQKVEAVEIRIPSREDTIKAVIGFFESRNNYLAVNNGYYGRFQLSPYVIHMFDTLVSDPHSEKQLYDFLRDGNRQVNVMYRSISFYDSLFKPQLELLKLYRTPFVSGLPSNYWVYWSHRFGICATFQYINDLIYHKVTLSDMEVKDHYRYIGMIRDSLNSRTFIKGLAF
jgi:hypothetical protein